MCVSKNTYLILSSENRQISGKLSSCVGARERTHTNDTLTLHSAGRQWQRETRHRARLPWNDLQRTEARKLKCHSKFTIKYKNKETGTQRYHQTATQNERSCNTKRGSTFYAYWWWGTRNALKIRLLTHQEWHTRCTSKRILTNYGGNHTRPDVTFRNMHQLCTGKMYQFPFVTRPARWTVDPQGQKLQEKRDTIIKLLQDNPDAQCLVIARTIYSTRTCIVSTVWPTKSGRFAFN